MDPRDFLTLAHALVKGGSAVECRSATSRAYYAAHLLAIVVIHRLGFEVPRNGKAHGLVSDVLLKCTTAKLRNAGMDLANLHVRRNAADYRLDDPIPEQPKDA